MTIIVWDGKTLVADKSTYKYNCVLDNQSNKIIPIQISKSDQYAAYYAGSGLLTDIVSIARSLQHNFETLDPMRHTQADKLHNLIFRPVEGVEEKNDGILVVFDSYTGKKHAYYVDETLILLPIADKYAAGNSDACLVALGALDAGADAETACQIACARTNMHVGSLSKVS